jgi:excisionase family DNA binding protein
MNDLSSGPEAEEAWLTVAEVADELRVNPATVRLWISKGSLSAKRVGQRKLFIARAELDRMLAETADRSDSQGVRCRPDARPIESGRRPGGDRRTGIYRLFPGMPVPAEVAQETNKQLQESQAIWDAALDSSDNAPPDPGFVGRLGAIADAARRQYEALNVAEDVAVRWRPVRGGEELVLSHELRRGANRPGPEDLWTSFDRTVERLGVAMEGSSIHLVALEYHELAEVLEAIVEALEGASDAGKPRR